MAFRKVNPVFSVSFAAGLLLVFGLGITVFVSQQQQDLRSSAAAPGDFVAGGALPTSLNNAGPYVINVPVIKGARYKIVISGWYRYQKDANYNSVTDAQWDDWLQNKDGCFCRRVNKVQFNGVSPEASNAYDPAARQNHEYIYFWTADSSNLEMYIADTHYHDNVGNLTYAVYLDSVSTP